MKLHTHVLFESKQTSHNIDFDQFSKSQSIYLLYLFYRLKIDEDETAAKVLELAVEAAQNTGLIPQQGFWFMGSIAVRL